MVSVKDPVNVRFMSVAFFCPQVKDNARKSKGTETASDQNNDKTTLNKINNVVNSYEHAHCVQSPVPCL